MAMKGFKGFLNKDKTFRPKKKFSKDTPQYNLHKHAEASLSAGIDLKQAVKLPPGENLNDWISVHVVDFWNRINLIYGTVSECCTEESCKVMSGGPKYEYLWRDNEQYKRPTALPATTYINLLMDWVGVQINDSNVFPSSPDMVYPKNYIQTVRKIMSRLFRVFVHVYIHHFERLCSIGAEAHVNTCYKHFYFFVSEFEVIDKKELEPLKEMTKNICHV
uniref:MATS1 n=1 Tax=Schmidtea mediterranea TaxID=79327 RepID=W8E0T2_SCHMD|nr:MATS1 [Schmidtea mediterranea]